MHRKPYELDYVRYISMNMWIYVEDKLAAICVYPFSKEGGA